MWWFLGSSDVWIEWFDGIKFFVFINRKGWIFCFWLLMKNGG